MVTVVGWIHITQFDDGNSSLIKQEVDRISTEYDSDINVSCVVQNGSLFVFISFLSNHRGSRIDEAINLFELAQKVLSQYSFGILRIWDDESDDYNQFIVHRLAKGKLEIIKDSILSPCVDILGEDVVF